MTATSSIINIPDELTILPYTLVVINFRYLLMASGKQIFGWWRHQPIDNGRELSIGNVYCGNDYSGNPLQSIWPDHRVTPEGKDWNVKRVCRPNTSYCKNSRLI